MENSLDFPYSGELDKSRDEVDFNPDSWTKRGEPHAFGPWRCNHSGCVYGCYTRKQLDRHINDKHSLTRVILKCPYEPCPYESERESHCKQHIMEAHGPSKSSSYPDSGYGSMKVSPATSASTSSRHVNKNPTFEFANLEWEEALKTLVDPEEDGDPANCSRLTQEQLVHLEREFQQHHKPNTKHKTALAETMAVGSAKVNVS